MAEIPTEIDACQPDEDDTFLGFAFLNNWRNELFQINLNAFWRWEGWLTSTTLGICILLQRISGTWFCNEGNFLHLIGKCLVYVACENYFSVIVVGMLRKSQCTCIVHVFRELLYSIVAKHKKMVGSRNAKLFTRTFLQQNSSTYTTHSEITGQSLLHVLWFNQIATKLLHSSTRFQQRIDIPSVRLL